jgi:hypothetical protein
VLVAVLWGSGAVLADEPQLPEGLGGSTDTPALPEGLAGSTDAPALPEGLAGDQDDEPTLPAGLSDGEEIAQKSEESDDLLPGWLSGFWDTRLGTHIRDPSDQRRISIAETRFQLGADFSIKSVAFSLTADFIGDALEDRYAPDLETGQGVVDLREANAAFSPFSFMEAKIGRQILTWGTGDFVFINDLFPKDFNAFFIGRDVEYLKAPSDALKISLFSDVANLDVVYTPRFDADRFIDGRRVSRFDATSGRILGRSREVRVDRPDDTFENDEWAIRLYRNFGAYEFAAYGYDGFWKSPAGFDPATGRALFPDLSVLGASLRGPLAGAIANAEVGYYFSGDDAGGANPLVRNSEWRALLGFEREIVSNLTLGPQYYIEVIDDHSNLVRNLPLGASRPDRFRHVLTARLTWLTLNQNLIWSLFAFYSPSDSDSYLRPRVTYKWTDEWTVEAGANVFLGAHKHTFFGQFKEDSNLYVSVRLSF